MVQWLGLNAPNAGGTGLIPVQGAKILHAERQGKKIEGEKTCLNSLHETSIILIPKFINC